METLIRVRVTLEVPYALLKPMLQGKYASKLFQAFLVGFLIPTGIKVPRVSISQHDVKEATK